MNAFRYHWPLLLFSFASLIPLCTDVYAVDLTEEWLRKRSEPLVRDKIVEGVSVAFLQGDRWGVVHQGNAGKSNKPANLSTLYEVGSISKVFTSLLLADAVVRGELRPEEAAAVDNPAGLRLPTHQNQPITWMHLSTHRSGLPRLPSNLNVTNPEDPYSGYSSRRAAEFCQSYTLPREPGMFLEYSNFGVSVLGYLLASKLDTSYETLLQDRIAKPLGLRDFSTQPSRQQRLRLAQPHQSVSKPTPPWDFADLPAAGGINASMRAMMRFARAVLHPPKNSFGKAIDLTWALQTEADESGHAMGMGWMIAGDGSTRWHNGGTGGSSSAIFINRDIDTAIIVLANTSATDRVDMLAMQLLQRAAEPEVRAAAKFERVGKAISVNAKEMDRLVGKYQLTPNFIFDVSRHDDQLMVGITNQATQPVDPVSETRWEYRSVDAALIFELPRRGLAKAVVLDQNGLKQRAKRVR